jgi:hypothetical protein
MQALSLEFLTLTGLGRENLLQFRHFASGSLGLHPSIRYHASRSQQKLSVLLPPKDASGGA